MASPVDLLRQTPVFSHLSEDDRNLLVGIGQTKLFPKGAVVFREGDPADDLYTVLRGRVKVFKTTPAGKEIILAILDPGAPVGAVAVYHGAPFPASAMAFEDSVLIRIPARKYFQLLETEPAFVRRLLSALTHRLMELSQRLPELAGGSVECRMARLLLRLAEQIGRPGEGGTFVPLHLSRQDLADFTGTTIETAIRIMSRWGKDGIVETTADGFLIKEPGALDQLASDPS